MAVKGVLFDLFGTLVNYDAGRVNQNFDSTYQLIRSFGSGVELNRFTDQVELVFAEMDVWSQEHQQEFSMQEFASKLFPTIGIPEPTENQLDQFSEVYTRDWRQGVEPIQGLAPFLNHVRKRFKTALISNTHYEPMVLSIIEEQGMGAFDLVTTSVTHGQPKPHPDIFVDALKQLDLSPEEAIYVGDNYRADYVGATEVGMTCYLIGRHARVPREFQIPTVLDLPVHLIR